MTKFVIELSDAGEIFSIPTKYDCILMRWILNQRLTIGALIISLVALSVLVWHVHSHGPVVDLTDENFETAATNGVVLVDFYANWCGPCRSQRPIIERVAAKVRDCATVASVDVDASPEIAGGFGIHSIPTLVVLKDGDQIRRFVGVTKEKIGYL